ncbi:MAG: DNA polymerase Y family protein, partial [Pseudomonadota bacterium]
VAHFTDAPMTVVPAGSARAALDALPPAALRLPGATVEGLEAVGLGRLGDLARLPRGQLARRFGLMVIRRLDQALGLEPEPVAPSRARPHFAARLTLPEPTGLTDDVMAGLERLLERVTLRLEAAEAGARALRLSVRRVDGADQSVAIRLARPMRDPMRLRALFAPKIDAIEAGYGIDALRLAVTEAEPMAPAQLAGGPRAVGTASAPSATHADTHESARLADLMSRIGNRIGFENLQRLVPADSHIPERAVAVMAAGYATAGDWRGAVAGLGAPRPLVLFPPEPAMADRGPHRGPDRGPDQGPDRGPDQGPDRVPDAADSLALYPAATPGWRPEDEGAPTVGARAPHPTGGTLVPPPGRFRWRGRMLSVAAAAGPERIAPEWWWDDPAWRSGPRDYWRVETAEGPRLWLFHTPAAPLPAWSVHGEFA